LVEIVRKHRLPDTILFLSEALHDNSLEVWKNALDGFVALSGPTAAQILESVETQFPLAGQTQFERIEWIDEAIR
jgi:hypothetical protein